MVIDQYPSGSGVGLHGVGQPVKTIDLVEIHAEDDICLCNKAGQNPFTVLLENSDLRNVTHPLQKIGITVRGNAAGGVPQPLQIGAPGQSRTNGIAIGICVAEQRNLVRAPLDQLAQAV